MNVYFLGMCISMVIYLLIGFFVSKKVKTANDYYVAGRNAPMILIAGSLIASYTSTGMFMGDAAQAFDGAFSSIILFAGMQSAGYIVGAVFFGRYLRRSGAMTIPEFFGKRFNSRSMRTLASVTAIIMMSVYLLSVIQGIGTLMVAVTGVDYKICITLALIVFSIVTIMSGSKGVLITDTLMASMFTVALLIGMVFVAQSAGGLYPAISKLVQNPDTTQILSWAGKPGALYDTGVENVIWGLAYGIVWMSVCAVGPWQSSRYMMAKDEYTIVRSTPISAIGVFVLEFIVSMAAVLVNVVNPGLEDSSQVMIYASMNMMPTIIGVILLTGVLAAGISSATTFLSLIGASFANDVFKSEGKKSIRTGQIAMIGVAVVVWVLAIFNPPEIFWIMFLGGAIVASSWMPVAFASIFSKRLTKVGAFAGMLAGFLGCFVMKIFSSVGGITLPVYLDPSIVGMLCCILAMVIGTALTKVTDEEKIQRELLFVKPATENTPEQRRKLIHSSKLAILTGAIAVLLMVVVWLIPYLKG